MEEDTGERQKGEKQEEAARKDFLVERMEETEPQTKQQTEPEGQNQERAEQKKDRAFAAELQKGKQTKTADSAKKKEIPEQSGEEDEKAAGELWGTWTAWLSEKGIFAAGILLLLTAAVLGIRLLWLHSAVLYCYNGGEEYRRLAVVHLRRRKEEFELELPQELLEQRGKPRYRLLLNNRLVKQCGSMDLVLKSEEHRARYPLEECVDFVL